MAKNETRRVTPTVLGEDREAFDALQAITSYAPANPAYKVETIRAARDRIDESQRELTQAEVVVDAKRAALTAAQWEFHNTMLGAKVQVEAQFGSNSDEYASLKLKKKSEYKRPSRRSGGSASTK
jgi:microcompartment protein CcmL/EutN